MGKKGGAETQVTQYFMSMHYGICAGPVDFMSSIIIGEKEAWSGQQADGTTFNISKEDLYGGIQKEGGVSGAVTYLPGDADQEIPDWIASKFGLSVDDMPAYRGIASAFFTGGSGSSRGFYWIANNPYLKGTWIEVARASLGLNEDYARIWRGSYTDARAIFFALDLSGSMGPGFHTPSRLSIAQSALTSVLGGIKTFLQAGGARVDVGFAGWSWPGQLQYLEKLDASPEDIDAMITWVNALTIEGGTDFNEAALAAVNFFGASVGDTSIKKRVMIFMTDGIPDAGTDTTAVATMADILDQSSGAYSTANGTAVDTYGINLDITGGSTYLLDNTPDDGVPSVSSDDDSGLLNAVNAALYPPAGGVFDSNPAHIIYECLTNKTWGMGTSANQIDVDSFNTAAYTLFLEGFGLSLIWTRQSTIEDFVSEILNHVEGALFVNPRTGLLTLKLIRDDYDADTLRVFTPDNADILNFKRKLWGETINEIVVTWTDPTNEEDASVTVQDAGNIAMQGDIVSDSRNYYGVRTVELATHLGYRDLRVASAPLAACDLEVDRSAWDLLPGDVCKIESPEDNVETIIMRVGPVDYGKPGSPKIKVSLVEDIFSLATAEYTVPDTTSWIDPSEDPAPAQAEYGFTLPYFTVAGLFGGGDIAAAALTYPTVYTGVLASQVGYDTPTYVLWGTLTDAAGNEYEDSLGEKTIIPRAVLATALVQEVTSTIPATLPRTQGHDPRSGDMILIGDGDETEIEVVLITAVDTNITVKRGVLDTTPKNWPIGTPIWFLDPDQTYEDSVARSVAEEIDYHVLPRTSKGVLDLSDADTLTVTAMDRPYLPLRPANVKANGTGFGTVNCELVDPVPLTWSERNRLTEETVILAWDAATVTPEDGTTYTVTLTAIDGTVINTITGLTGTSYDLDHSAFGAYSRAWVKVEAVRDGYTSLQGHEIMVVVESGYGYSYGFDYGGS